MGKNLESPEEMGEGNASRTRGQGIARRGRIPRRRGRSRLNPVPEVQTWWRIEGKLAPHLATAGRGGSGIIGKGDSFKGHAEDLEHPQSHGAEFEQLGQGGGPGGED